VSGIDHGQFSLGPGTNFNPLVQAISMKQSLGILTAKAFDHGIMI